jgi:hypothetical protein
MSTGTADIRIMGSNGVNSRDGALMFVGRFPEEVLFDMLDERIRGNEFSGSADFDFKIVLLTIENRWFS